MEFVQATVYKLLMKRYVDVKRRSGSTVFHVYLWTISCIHVHVNNKLLTYKSEKLCCKNLEETENKKRRVILQYLCEKKILLLKSKQISLISQKIDFA